MRTKMSTGSKRINSRCFSGLEWFSFSCAVPTLSSQLWIFPTGLFLFCFQASLALSLLKMELCNYVDVYSCLGVRSSWRSVLSACQTNPHTSRSSLSVSIITSRECHVIILQYNARRNSTQATLCCVVVLFHAQSRNMTHKIWQSNYNFKSSGFFYF